jgi:cytochrome c oxidase cbb3-type subunit III
MCGGVQGLIRMFCFALRGSTRLVLQWTASLSLFAFAAIHAHNAVARTPAAPAWNAMQQQTTGEGRQLFESACAGCHGLDGRGGERGPDIATRQQVVQLTDAEIMEILKGGRPAAGMPPFGSLGGVKLKALLSYLRSLQGKGSAAPVAGDPHNGKALYFGTARCSECHMMQGTGGFLGRDLSTYGATLSPAEIRSNIVRSGPNPSKANKTAVVTMRDSRKFSGVIRNEDNFSIQLQSFDGAFHFLNRSEVAQSEFLPEPIMPANYATTLKPSELDDIVSYLVNVARAGKSKNQADGNNDDF